MLSATAATDERTMDIDLTERKDVFAWIIGLGFLALLVYAGYLILAPFARPLMWAGVFATLLTPLQAKLARWIPRAGLRAGATCVIAVLLVIGPLASFVAILIGELVSGLQQVQQNVDKLPNLDPTTWGFVGNLRDWLATNLGGWVTFPSEDVAPLPNLEDTILSVAEAASQWLLSSSPAAAGSVASFGFGLFVMAMALFYFLRDGDRLVGWMVDLFPATVNQKRELLEKLDAVVASSVVSGVAVAAAQGALGAVGFYLVGLPSALLWGTAMALLSFLPLVGPAVVWLPAAVVLAAQGRWIAAIFLVAWGVIAVGLVDNVLRPMLMSGGTNMHPLVAFLSVVGGLSAFGMIGFLLGPIIAVVGQTVIETLRQDAEAPA
jgi:predicted PurR-regulated permease PerM